MKLYFYLAFLSVIFGSSQALHEFLRRAMAEEGSGGLNEKGFSYRQTVLKFPNEDVTVVSNKTSVNGASTIYNTKADREGRLTTNAEKLTAGVVTSNGHVEQNGAISAVSKTSSVDVKHQDLNTSRRNKLNFGIEGSATVETKKQSSQETAIDAQLLQRARLLQDRGPSRRVPAPPYRTQQSNAIPAIENQIIQGRLPGQLQQPEQPEQPGQPEQPEQPQQPGQSEQQEQPEQPEQQEQPEQPEQPAAPFPSATNPVAIEAQILQGLSLQKKPRSQFNPTGRRLSPYGQPRSPQEEEAEEEEGDEDEETQVRRLPNPRVTGRRLSTNDQESLDDELLQDSGLDDQTGRRLRQVRRASRIRQGNVMQTLQGILSRPKRNQNRQCSCLNNAQRERIHRSAISLLNNLSRYFEQQVSGFIKYVVSMPNCL